MNTSALIDRPHCPRCRYEIGGVIASWHEQCPLGGTCPECGLTFDWPDVLRVDRQRDERFIEHTSKWWRLPRAAWRTWWRALYPPGFWRWVKLHHEVRPKRMVLWLAAVFILLWSLNGSMLTVYAAVAAVRAFRPWAATLWGFGNLQAWQYCDIWLSPMFRSQPAGWGGSGAITCELVDLVPLPADQWPHMIRWALAVQMAWVVMLLVLPWTLRRAKVGTGHIFRAWAYSMSCVVLFVILVLFIRMDLYTVSVGRRFGVYPVWGDFPSWFDRTWWSVVPLAMIAWLCWWWYVVIVRHWRIERGRMVWSVLLIPVLLAGFIAYLWPDPPY